MLSAKEFMLLHCGVGEASWESLGQQGDPTSPSWGKSVLNIHWKDWCWSWNSNILATQCEELTHWKRPWGWERLKAGGEGDNRGWDGWMASPTWWTWVWVSSRSWWWTGKPSVLQSTGLQKRGHDWMPELNWGHLRSALGWILNVSLLKNQPSSVSQCLHTKTIFEGLPLELSSRFKEVIVTFGWTHSSWRRLSTTPALMHRDGGSLECLQCAAVYSMCSTVLSHLPAQ